MNPPAGHEFVTSKGRFVHLRRQGDANTVCGAMPAYYGGHNLRVVAGAEAENMHVCKACQKITASRGRRPQ